ncbi:MAG: hypothetical protein ABI377_05195 [Devosia sp.]
MKQLLEKIAGQWELVEREPARDDVGSPGVAQDERQLNAAISGHSALPQQARLAFKGKPEGVIFAMPVAQHLLQALLHAFSTPPVPRSSTPMRGGSRTGGDLSTTRHLAQLELRSRLTGNDEHRCLNGTESILRPPRQANSGGLPRHGWAVTR